MGPMEEPLGPTKGFILIGIGRIPRVTPGREENRLSEQEEWGNGERFEAGTLRIKNPRKDSHESLRSMKGFG